MFSRDGVHDGGGIGGDEHPHAHADDQDGDGKCEIDEVGRYQQQPDEANTRHQHTGGGEDTRPVAVGKVAADRSHDHEADGQR